MKKLYLSKTDKKIAGVCGGLAEYFQMDSALMRLIIIFIALCTAVVPAIITYIIAALIIPHHPSTIVHDVKESKEEKHETKEETVA
jgi:phage shock protein C